MGNASIILATAASEFCLICNVYAIEFEKFDMDKTG